jgi:hypothetical protein
MTPDETPSKGTPPPESVRHMNPLSRIPVSAMVAELHSRFHRLPPHSRDAAIQSIVEPFVMDKEAADVDAEMDTYHHSPIDASSLEASLAADLAVLDGVVSGTRAYQFSDYLGMSQELHLQITKASTHELISPEAKPLLDGLITGAGVLVDSLVDKSEMDAMMAEDMIGMAMALTGKARVDIMPDNDLIEEGESSVGQWAKECFPHCVGPKNKALSLLGEAIDLVYSTGCSSIDIANMFKFSVVQFGRDPDRGHVTEKVADVQILLWSLASELDMESAEEAEEKMMYNRSRSADYYLERTKQKLLLGMPLLDPPAPGDAPMPATPKDGDDDE